MSNYPKLIQALREYFSPMQLESIVIQLQQAAQDRTPIGSFQELITVIEHAHDVTYESGFVEG